MKNLYLILRNLMVFTFIVVIFGSNNIIKDNSVSSILLVGLLFGIVMMLIPSVLKYFKLPITPSTVFVMSLIFSFLFYFLGLYVFNLINIPSSGVLDFGVSFIQPIKLQDRTVTIVLLSLFSAFISSLIDFLSKKK